MVENETLIWALDCFSTARRIAYLPNGTVRVLTQDGKIVTISQDIVDCVKEVRLSQALSARDNCVVEAVNAAWDAHVTVTVPPDNDGLRSASPDANQNPPIANYSLSVHPPIESVNPKTNEQKKWLMRIGGVMVIATGMLGLKAVADNGWKIPQPLAPSSTVLPENGSHAMPTVLPTAIVIELTSTPTPAVAATSTEHPTQTPVPMSTENSSSAVTVTVKGGDGPCKPPPTPGPNSSNEERQQYPLNVIEFNKGNRCYVDNRTEVPSTSYLWCLAPVFLLSVPVAAAIALGSRGNKKASE